jgi:hypothetical protein
MNWTCPHCNKAQTTTNANSYAATGHLAGSRTGKFEGRGYFILTICCANIECGKFTIEATIGYLETFERSQSVTGSNITYVPQPETALFSGRVYPSPSGKPQPSYIPPQIVQDYQEACLIKDLSPKASATLARRAVQGIIRDFTGISERRLVDEISKLRTQVTNRTAPPEFTLDLVDAIDGVRQIGNIGAHMEKDVSMIVDVEPEEAGLLINLIEDMFELLYVARATRAERLSKLASVVESKKAQKAIEAPAPGGHSGGG